MGIVKKRITRKKSKNNLSKLYNLEGGAQKVLTGPPKLGSVGPTKPGSVGTSPSLKKQGSIGIGPKRSENQSYSRITRLGEQTKKFGSSVASVGKASVRGLTTLYPSFYGTAVRGAVTLPTRIAYEGVKGIAKSAAYGTQALYQKDKLRRSQRQLNRITGEDVFEKHKKSEIAAKQDYDKKLAAIENKAKASGNLGDIARLKDVLNLKFQANKTKRNDALKKRLTTRSTWSRIKKPFSKNSGYKMTETDYDAKIGQQSAEYAKQVQEGKHTTPTLTDFSSIIAEKKAAYNAAQTAKQNKYLEQFDKQKNPKYLALSKTHEENKSNYETLNKEYTENATEFKVLFNLARSGPLTQEQQDRAKILKTMIDDKTKNRARAIAKKKADTSQLSLDKFGADLNTRKLAAEKTVSKKPYYTTSNIQSSINRRRVRLNSTMGNIRKTWSNAGKKISRTAQKAYEKGILGFSAQQGIDFARYGRGKQREKRKQQLELKEKAYKQNKRLLEQKEGPSFFSSLKNKLTPNFLRGATTLQKQVEHINFLGELKTDMSSLEKQMEPNKNRDFNGELTALQLKKELMNSEEYKKKYDEIEQARKNFNKLKDKKIELEMISKTRQNKLEEITKELTRRTNKKTIQNTTDIFNRIPDTKKDKFGILYSKDPTTGKQQLKNIDQINMLDILSLLKTYKDKNKPNTYGLLEALYKHKKNTTAIKKFQDELDSIKTPIPVVMTPAVPTAPISPAPSPAPVPVPAPAPVPGPAPAPGTRFDYSSLPKTVERTSNA